MNLLRASYFRKTGAILFFALFVFVHAIKALHTHEISLIPSHYHGDSTNADIKADFSCSICDFQIAKDSDALISNVEFSIFARCISVVYNYILPVYNYTVTNSSGTDPPSFA